MAAQNGSASADTKVGCVLLVGLVLFLGQCMFGGDDDADQANDKSPSDAQVSSSDITGSSSTTMLEKAIEDAFPSDGSSGSKDAADLLAFTVNRQGHLCAQVVEAQQASAGWYGLRCVLHNDGSGRANYLLNASDGSVQEI